MNCKLNNKMIVNKGFTFVKGFCQSHFERNGFRLYESLSESGYFVPSQYHQLKVEYLDELEILIKMIDKKPA